MTPANCSDFLFHLDDFEVRTESTMAAVENTNAARVVNMIAVSPIASPVSDPNRWLILHHQSMPIVIMSVSAKPDRTIKDTACVRPYSAGMHSP
jgi:hypothetical protein